MRRGRFRRRGRAQDTRGQGATGGPISESESAAELVGDRRYTSPARNSDYIECQRGNIGCGVRRARCSLLGMPFHRHSGGRTRQSPDFVASWIEGRRRSARRSSPGLRGIWTPHRGAASEARMGGASCKLSAGGKEVIAGRGYSQECCRTPGAGLARATPSPPQEN